MSAFDRVLCHRMAHLLVTPEAIDQFARKAESLLKPGGLLFVGARNPLDLRSDEMVPVADQVYEYIRRPGHRIRYWDDATFWDVFGKMFTILALTPAIEDETAAQPVPCHLTIMVARKRPTPLEPENRRP
jgi:hypothetical protein